ncbi:MAG: FAD-dependent oxidoreductase [bacterium]
MTEVATYDVVVIGGGVVGSGVARDCAMRGLKTMLVEKKDFAGGTTGACMGMIHGGLRYLLYDVKTTKMSCTDSGFIQQIAPHLLFRIPFITPVMKGDSYPIDLVETFMECYDDFAHLKKSKKHTRLSPAEARQIEPGLSENIVGAVTIDEYGINPFRLCAGNAVSASEHGADIRNHTKALKILKNDAGAVTGLLLKDLLTGVEQNVSAKLIVNAAGPWTSKVADMAGVEVKLRPGKGINVFFDRRITNYAVVAEAVDGRQVLIMPYENSTMMGCTDDDFYGDLDHLTATHDEIEYLLQALERVFPSIREHRMIRVMTGVRPTLFEWRKIEDKLTREHEIFDHETRDGVPGFVSVAGGKLATFRIMAEETTDLICKKLNVCADCRTHKEPLPGGDSAPDLDALAAEYNVPAYAVRRLFTRQGSRCVRILEMIKSNRRLANFVCRCEPVMEAEIRYVIRHEWARTPDDIRRRTRMGTGPCQSARCNYKAAAILAEETGMTPEQAWQSAAEFMQQRWKGKFPILRGEQIAQEELNRAIYFTAGNYGEFVSDYGV